MLDLIEGSPGFSGDLGQAHPNQNRAGDMVALNPGFLAWAAFQSGQLLGFAVKLLDLSAHATRLLRGRRGILRKVVGDDPVRAVGRHSSYEARQQVA